MKDRLEPEDYLSDEELRALLKAARDRLGRRAARDHVLLALLANTGIRPGEAVQLTPQDLELTNRRPFIRVRRLKKRVAAAPDELPISRPLARTLKRYVQGAAGLASEPLFPMTVRNLELIFKHYLKLAAIAQDYRLYALRHTAFTRAYRVTKDLRLVQELAGHASSATTLIYTHVDPQAKRRAVELVGATL